MNKEIIQKTEEIVDYIKKTPEYQGYLQAKSLLAKDTKLNKIISDIKTYQKEILKSPNKKEELEEKINKSLSILEESYLYNEYNNYLRKVNNLLAILENKLTKYLKDLVE